MIPRLKGFRSLHSILVELFGVGHCLTAFSSTLPQKWVSGSQTFLYCPLLVCTFPVVGMGCGSAEEILLLAISHWFTLNCFMRPIFALIIDKETLVEKIDVFSAEKYGSFRHKVKCFQYKTLDESQLITQKGYLSYFYTLCGMGLTLDLPLRGARKASFRRLSHSEVFLHRVVL